MEHKELDDWVKTEMGMSDNSVLIYSGVSGQTKTVITRNSFSGNVWLYQSSIDDKTELETKVDVIRLEKRIAEVLTIANRYIHIKDVLSSYWSGLSEDERKQFEISN